MKKLFILLGLASICILQVFSQTKEANTQGRVEQYGFTTTAIATKEDNSAMNRLLNEVLTYDVDISEMLSPILLKAFAHYSVRRVSYGERDIIFNKKLSTLLQGLEDNVEQLENTEEYIKELRIILTDTKNPYILAKTLSLYGTIIEKNLPAVSDKLAYSPQRLYIVDTMDALRRISIMADNETQSMYVILQVIPYLRKAMKEDPTIIQDGFFQSGISYIAAYYSSCVAGRYIGTVLQDIIKLEIQELVASK